MTRQFKLLAIAVAALIGCGSALAQGTNQGSSPATVLKGGTGASTASGARTNLGVAIGSNVEAWDADLDALAALSGTNTIYYRSGASAWSAVSIGGLLSFAGGTLNVGDAELVALAGLTSAADKCAYFTGSGTAALMDCPSWSRSVTSAASASAGRTAFGLAIGTDVQAFDAELAALAGLTSANNKCFYWTGTASAANFDCSSFGRSVTNVADAAALRTLAGAVIGTNVQAWDADLDALAALAGTNTIYYRSAANTWTAVSIGGLLSFSAGTLNVGDAELVALAGLTSAADKCAYFTGSGAAALIDCLSWSRSVTSAASASAGRTAFGLAIGTDVQAYNVNLAAYAGLTGAAGKIGYFTAAGTMALFDSTSFGRSVSSAADASALRTLSGAVIGTNVQAWDADIDALAANSTNGLWARTGAGTGAARTATGTVNEVCVTNGDGVSGNPTFGICAGWLATARTYSATQTFAGLIATGVHDVQGTLKLSSFVTSTQLTANANDYTGTDGSNTCTAKTSIRISTNASRNITGLSCGQAEGDLRIVHNVGSNPAVLVNQDASSTATNRFLFGGDMTVAADTSVTLRYDGVASRWRAITSPGAGGGGGGVTSVTVGGTTISTSGTLPAVAYDAAQSLTNTQKAQAQANIALARTRQVFTSGSGTYTTPTGARTIVVRMVGGGGGGGGAGGAGNAGGASTFGTTFLTANGGAGGSGGTGGVGGSATGGDVNIAGAYGGSAVFGASGLIGGGGGATPFGGAGMGYVQGSGGSSGSANSGSGGAGASSYAGGAAGGYLEKMVASPLSTYSYAVGAGGSAPGGGSVGGSAIIIVDEFYQ